MNRTCTILAMAAATAMLLPNARATETAPGTTHTAANFNPIDQFHLQLRAGYITLDEKGAPTTNGYALGGHVRVDSKRYWGLMAGVALYTVQDLGLTSSDSDRINPDFYDADLGSYSLLGQAFVDGKWGNTDIRLGRQQIDTPHADSDDIRMIPNLFNAYLLTNSDISGLTLTAGLIDHMVGWEDEFDASRFVDVGKVMESKLGSGLEESTTGAYLLAAVYDGIENLELQAWGYRFDDVADVIYLEGSYALTPLPDLSLDLSLQYDRASDCGDKLGGSVDSNTWGVSIEAGLDRFGLALTAAYNQDNGDTGAFPSLGGGPFFTSIEDQTLDAVGQQGDAYTFGAGYDFSVLGIEGLNFSGVYGRYKADNSDEYKTDEIDLTLEYSFLDRYTATAALAMIDDRTAADADYNQFRIILTADF